MRTKTMVRLCWCFFLLATSSFLAAQVRVVTWATNPQYPPYDWLNANQEYDGAATELLALIAPSGVQFEEVQVPWKRAQELAKLGKIDLLVNLRITSERQEWLKFSTNPTFANPIAVFTLESRTFPLKSWDLLKPLYGGISLGDTFGNGFDEYLKANLKTETGLSMVENFRKLDAGRIDYFVTGLNPGLAWLSASRLPNKIVALSPPISTDSIHLGMSRLSPHLDLLPALDKRLAQLKAEGALEKILQRNLEKYAANPVGAQQ